MRSSKADFSRKVHCLLGLPFDAITLAEATEHIRQAAFNCTPCFFSTPNLNFLIAAQGNKVFRESVIKSDLSLPDGMPIVWLSKLLGLPIHERVAGSDVFEALRKGTGRKIKVYFFGGQPGVAEKAMQVLNAEDGGLQCVGFESPGFGSIAEMSTPESLQKINASGAEFLVVSLGAVKGQAWIEHNLDGLLVPVVSHLGAVVNFVAGNVSRAPRWMQKAGLEWVWRIVEEPGLWRRYRADQVSVPLQHSCSAGHLEVDLAVASAGLQREALRALFSQFADSHTDVTLRMKNAQYLDSASLGLLALLCGQQLNRGLRLTLKGQQPTMHSFDVPTKTA
jgi:N-acetylglucosaminyldiphosphoundecaprenol N-acetyl-beta-D-mannosaminyltransferase